ncbi:MAG: hypothetical protein LBP19_01750 [Treponema sp.]|nr:hypothetical protein [Treponema sp.]
MKKIVPIIGMLALPSSLCWAGAKEEPQSADTKAAQPAQMQEQAGQTPQAPPHKPAEPYVEFSALSSVIIGANVRDAARDTYGSSYYDEAGCKAGASVKNGSDWIWRRST